MSSLFFRSAKELSDMIINNSISSAQAVDACLSRIKQINPEINAIITLNPSARQQAEEADAALHRKEVWGPLHGVPITVKDVFETRGIRTTAGYVPLKDYFPNSDASVVARIKKAGAIIIGKTNTPALAMDVQTENPIFGATVNPWNRNRTCGGSSGGDAAAVATGMSPLSIGSDIGGSVRIPAHFCGIFAFKPSEGVVSLRGHIPPLPNRTNTISHLAVPGVQARSVADLKLWCHAVSAPLHNRASLDKEALRKSANRSLSTYRFLWSDRFGELKVSGETRHALEELVQKLTGAGCVMKKVSPEDIAVAELWQCYGELFALMAYATMPALIRWGIRMMMPVLTRDPISRAGARKATGGIGDYFSVLEKRERLVQTVSTLLSDFDGWITPVTSAPAFVRRKMGKIHTPIDVDGTLVPGNLAATGYTCPFNLTGHPSVVLPVSVSKDGLPIGLQIVGQFQKDVSLLDTAAALTKVTGVFRPPPLC